MARVLGATGSRGGAAANAASPARRASGRRGRRRELTESDVSAGWAVWPPARRWDMTVRAAFALVLLAIPVAAPASAAPAVPKGPALWDELDRRAAAAEPDLLAWRPHPHPHPPPSTPEGETPP